MDFNHILKVFINLKPKSISVINVPKHSVWLTACRNTRWWTTRGSGSTAGILIVGPRVRNTETRVTELLMRGRDTVDLSILSEINKV